MEWDSPNSVTKSIINEKEGVFSEQYTVVCEVGQRLTVLQRLMVDIPLDAVLMSLSEQDGKIQFNFIKHVFSTVFQGI